MYLRTQVAEGEKVSPHTRNGTGYIELNKCRSFAPPLLFQKKKIGNFHLEGNQPWSLSTLQEQPACLTNSFSSHQIWSYTRPAGRGGGGWVRFLFTGGNSLPSNSPPSICCYSRISSILLLNGIASSRFSSPVFQEL